MSGLSLYTMKEIVGSETYHSLSPLGNVGLISISVSAIRRVALFIPLIGIQITGAAFFQSVGKAVPSLILGMTRQIIFLIPLVLILPHFLGLNGVWLSFPGADIGAFTVTLFWLFKELKSLGILHIEHSNRQEDAVILAKEEV